MSSDVEMDAPNNNLAYDPDQDPDEKRDVRKKYRAMQKSTEGVSIDPKKDNLTSNRATDQRTQPKDYSAEELTAQVHAADALFDKGAFPLEPSISVFDSKTTLFAVKNPQEATLDSHVLLNMSNTTAAKARAMKSGQGAFDIDDFVSKLITFMGGRKTLDEHLPDESDVEEANDGDSPLDWEKIGRKALAKSRRVPAMDFMSASMLGPDATS